MSISSVNKERRHHTQSLWTQSNVELESVNVVSLAFVCVYSFLGGGFSGGSVIKNPPAEAEGTSLIPGLGRSPGEGNGNPLQYSCLGNPMDRGAWWATVHRVTKNQTRLNIHTHNILLYECSTTCLLLIVTDSFFFLLMVVTKSLL